MMSASLSETVMRRIFLDSDSPYALAGFSVSLHGEVSQSDGATEINAQTYARAVYGQGEGYWALGARTVQNKLEIVFPASGASEYWPAVRSIGLWSMDSKLFLWSVAFDIGTVTIGGGDRLVVPVGGLVMGLG